MPKMLNFGRAFLLMQDPYESLCLKVDEAFDRNGGNAFVKQTVRHSPMGDHRPSRPRLEEVRDPPLSS